MGKGKREMGDKWGEGRGGELKTERGLGSGYKGVAKQGDTPPPPPPSPQHTHTHTRGRLPASGL